MKRAFKRWLAMLLAVLMVMGTLPTTAFAARVDSEEQSETPVLEQGDGVADALKKDEGETPEKPVDPTDPDPADPGWANWTIEITELNDDGSFTVHVNPNGEGINDPQGSGDIGFALVPNLKSIAGNENIHTPETLTGNGTITNKTFGDEMKTALGFTGLPDGTYFVGANAKFNMTSAAGYDITGNLPNDIARIQKLLETVYDEDDNKYDASQGIPFIAILVTQANENGITTAHKTVGGGLSDSTWVVNINDKNVKRMDGSELTPVDGANYSPGTRGVKIPLINTSATEYTILFDGATGILPGDPTEYVSNPDGCTVTGTSATYASQTSAGELPFTLADTNARTLVFQVPYYTADGAKVDTVTVTVIVVKEGLMASPITYHLNVAEDETVTCADSAQGLTIIGYTGDALYYSEDAGSMSSGGEDYGLGLDQSNSLQHKALAEGINGDTFENLGEEGWTAIYSVLLVGSDTDMDTGDTASAAPKMNLDVSVLDGSTLEEDTVSQIVTLVGVEADGVTTYNITVPITVIIEKQIPGAKYNYSLVYNLDGGSGAAFTNQSVTDKTEANWPFNIPADPADTPTKTNYTFAGWKHSGDGTYDATAHTVTLTGKEGGATATLTAQWTPTYTYQLVYNLKGGSGGPTSPETDGPTTATTKTWTLSSTAPTLTGYTFGGWATTDGGTDKVTSVNAAAGSAAAGSTITTNVYAIWTVNQHTVTYHLNSIETELAGVTMPGPDRVNYSATYSVKSVTAPTGWTFNGWATSANGTVDYVPGDATTGSFSMPDNDVDLYAKWTHDTYTVTFNPEGGKWGTSTDNVTRTGYYNANISVPDAPTKDDYRFDGWYTAASGGTAMPNSPTFPANNTTTYHAHWVGQSSVTFDATTNGGTWVAGGGLSSQTGDVSTNVTMPSDPTKNGYTFTGWATTSTGTGSKNQITFPATPGGSQTYYAIFEPNKATVTANIYLDGSAAANLSDDPVGSGKVYLSTAAATLTNEKELTKSSKGVYSNSTIDLGTYYIFVNGTATNISVVVPAGGTVSQSVQYWTVNYQDTANHHTGDLPVRAIVLNGGSHTVDTTGLTGQTGWSFKQWEQTAGTKASTTITNITSSVTLEAAWDEVTYTVKFNNNGHGTAPADITKQAGVSTGTFTNPTDTNYDFGGWFEASDLSGTAVTSLTKTTAGTFTVYAKWTPKNYTITWDGNGGGWTSPTATTKTESRAYDSVIPIYGTEPTRTYYTFNGWYTEPACTNKVTFSETAPKVTGNMTYYAGWTQKTSNVVINFKKTAVGAAAADFDVSGEVTLNGTAYKATVTNGHTVKISGVPQGTTSYNVYFAGVDTTETVTVVDGTDGADMTTPVTVDFYEMEVKTNDKGTGTVTAANTALVMTAAGVKTTTLSASTTSSAGDKIIVMAGGKVDWSYSETTANYTFDYWDSDTPENKNNPSEAAANAAVSHTANFVKSSFDAFLVVRSNTTPQIDYTKDIKKVELVDGSGTSLGTPSYDTSHWKVTAISNDKSGNWRVTTVDGGTYTVPMLKNETDQTMDLFGVKVVDTKPTGCTAATVTGGTGSSAAPRVVVPLGQAVTAVETHSNGYTLVEWQDNADPDKAHVSFTDTNKGTVTLQDNTGTENDYTNDADLVITPTYTYEMKINPTRGGATCTTEVTGVQVKNGGTTVTATKGTDNMWTAEGLTPGTTYDIWVNGYKSDKTTNATTETSTVAVPIWAVIADDDPDGAAQTKTVGGAAQVYLPNGANDATGLALAATAKAGYRARTATETVKPWAITDGDDGAVSADFSKVTVTDIQADLTVTANFVKRWKITKAMRGNANGSAVNFGTVTAPDTASDDVATLDEGHVVAITAVPSAEQQVQGWAITGGDGKLYSDPDCATEHEIANPAAHTGATVYAKAATADATVTVTFESREYEITVQVNKDNADLEGASVNLYTGTPAAAIGTAKTTNASGEATFTVTEGTYTIYTNATGTMETAIKTVTVNATDTPAGTASKEVNYYTVTVEKAVTDSGTLPNTFYANHGTTASSSGATTKVFLAKEGDDATTDVSINATSNNQTASSGLYYRFKDWSAKAKADATAAALGSFASAVTTTGNTFKLPNEATLKANTNIKKDNGITLTATFQRQFKVTVENGSAPTATSQVKVRKTGDTTAWTSVTADSIFVDEGDQVDIYGTNSSNDYVLSQWEIKETGGVVQGAGTFANTGHANTTGAAATNRGYLFDGTGTFTPTADTVLVLNAWRRPNLTAGWTYDIGTGTGTTPTGDGERRATWTAYDASAVTGVAIVNRDNAAAFNEVLTVGSSCIVSGTNHEYYTVSKTYLTTVPVPVPKGTYNLQLTYTLGPDGHPNQLTNQTKADGISITVNKHALTKVDIQVKDGTLPATPDDAISGSATANVNVDARDAVRYEDHTVTDVAKSQLRYQWYSSTTEIVRATNSTVFADDADMTAASAKSAKDKAEAFLTARKTSHGVEILTGETAETLSVATKNTLKGKYVFALVYVVSTSAVSQGAVITNAIPVDYDATITVHKDGAAATAHDNYKVYLVPSGTTVAQADFATPAARAAKGIKEATHVAGTDGDGVYSTKSSAMTGATNYTVWVNDAESSTHYLHATEVGTVTPTSNTGKVVNYFSVNRVAFTQTHFQDNGNNPVGETFTAGSPAINSVTTGNGSAVADGAGVHTGTSVTATSATWTQDYTLTWQRSTNNDALANTATVQNSATANGTGYANGAVTAKTNLGGVLAQNTYTITGNVKGTGQIEHTGANVPTLTANEHTFNAKEVTNSGADGAVVTFVVPKSGVTAGTITGSYTIAATPKTSPATTILGYAAPAVDTLPTPSDPVLDQVTAGGSGKFTVFIEATDLRIEVKDDDDAAHKQGASGIGTATVTHSDKEKFADYSALTRVVTITNKGNTPLNVTLVLQKTKGGTTTDIYKTGTDLGGDDKDTDTANGVKFAGLERTFSLAVNASKSFTVTIPADLNNDDDVEYHFNFTTKDGRDGVTANGPTGVYNLNVVIDPVTVSKVTTTKVREGAGGTGKVKYYQVTKTEVAEDGSVTGTPHYDALVTMEDGNYNNPAGNADIVYEWYVAPWDAKVTLDKTNGVPKYVSTGAVLDKGTGTCEDNNTKYYPAATENGMALFLVAKGQRDATSAAMTPDVDAPDPEPVELVPYAASIQIIQNTTPITTTADAAGYKVELRLKNPPTTMPENVPSTVTATWDDTDHVFKTEERLWASDPEHPDTANPWTYEVWANTVKGAPTLQNTGKTITVADSDEDVVYYQVNINDTSVNQNTYQGKITPADDTTHFYADAPHVPTAKTTTDNIDVADKGWVQTGTNVTFTYDQWTKDYDLAWTGAVSATGDKPNSGNKTHTATYSSQLAAVDTTLTLNLYPVVANVTGTAGWVNKLTMVLTENGKDYTFVTKVDGTDEMLAIDQSGLDSTTQYRIAISKSVTFQLPKADGYVTTANVPDQANSGVERWEYVYNGTTPGRPTNENATVNVDVTGTNDAYAVNLIGAGLNMTVSETALPTNRTNTTTMQSRMGSIPNAVTADVTNGTVNQTIHLNYNYPTGQTVIMDVENTTNGLPIYRVARGTATINPANCITETNFTGGTMVAGDKETITLTIADNLKAGSYQYSTVFTFYSAETGDRHATVTYNLTVVVDPLPFNTVTTQTTSGTHSIKDYTVKELVTNNILTNDTQTGLTAGSTNDYLYQWVRADIGTTPTVTWDGTAANESGLITVTDGTKITGATNSSYTPAVADEGKALYLVIFATKDGNASGYAISDPITTGYTGLIRVNVDGVQVTGASDPNYTVKFVPSDAAKPTVDGTWNGATDNTAGYTATLNPEVASYSVQVSRAQGDATNLVPLTGVTITNDDRDADAYYFTVTAKDFSPKDYIPGSTGETFADADKQFTMTVGSGASATALASDTPVLKDQSVTAKATGWTQDYKLTWQSANTTTNVSADAATADKGAAQTTGTASGTGYTQTITDTTVIGGRLDQNTYTVTGQIKNPDDKTGGVVDKVELTFVPETGDARTAFTLTATDGTTGDHVFHDNNNDGTYGNVNSTGSDTVTFKVVKGVYNITAYEGNNTTITSVTIGGAGDSEHATEVNNSTTWATRNKETMTPAVADDTRLFSIYVEARDLRLKVADGHTTPHEVTSTMTNNDQHADHPQTYYFNSITGSTTLNLSNPGNADLKVNAKVFRFDSMSDVPNFATGDWTGGTTLVSGTQYTYNNLGSVIIINTQLAANANLAKGATNVHAGVITVKPTAANTDDGVYIIRFTSATTPTEGADVDGPTVYYVFDLTVDPLPIVGVDAVKDDTTGVMSLEGYDATNPTNKSGLDHVLVDHDGSAATPAVAANAHGIVNADVSYAWAKADVGVAVDASKFELSGTSIAPKTGVTDVAIIPGATGKTYTPVAADSGKNIYLIAYRSSANANTTDFAVSEALYANVTVAFHAYQTGHATELTAVHVSGTYDGGTAVASPNTITTKNAGDTIDFAADMADNATPANATYYFKEWDPTTMTAGVDRYNKTLTVTEPTTVIGYYDLLPEILPASSTGYNTDVSAYNNGKDTVAETAARTLVYDPHDGSGSGKVEIWIEPATASDIVEDGIAVPTKLGDLAFATGTVTPLGGQGNYILDKTWRENNLKAGCTYKITFYDIEKGQYSNPGAKTPNTDGYPGYDRSIQYAIVDGEKNVTAKVNTATPWGTVTLTNNATPQGAAGPSETPVTLITEAGSVNLIAAPKDGYLFAGWTKESPTVDKGTITNPASKTTTYTGVRNANETVIATFEKGELSMADQTAKVIYGNQSFEGTAPKMTATSTAEGESFKYSFVPMGDLASAGITDPDATPAPDWLKLNDDGTFGFNGPVDTNVESSDPSTYTPVTNELVVYVKATAQETGVTIIKKVTIDVERGTLTINTPSFTVPGGALGGQPVDLTQFTYTSVTDQASTEVIKSDGTMDQTGDHTEKGTWSVVPTNYVGNDRNDPTEESEYTFTFTYGPAADTAGAEKWNYKPTEKKLSFHVDKPPQTIYIADQIKNGSQVVAGTTYQTQDGTDMTGKNNDVPVKLQYAVATKRLGETITYLDAEPTYTVKIKGEGNLYGMSLTKADLTGFVYATGAAPTVNATWADGDTLDFDLKLSAMSGSLWKGVHTASFEVTGYSEPDAENQTDATKITATYELSIEVLPRTITKVDVTVTDPETDPTAATPIIDGNPPIGEDGRDEKGNTPIKDVDVTWGPEGDKPDGKNTEVKVDVEIDPNYVYEKDDPDTTDKDEDITKNTDVHVTDHLTPDPVVTRDPAEGGDPDHIIHIDQKIPYLMHADLKVDSDPADATGPKVTDRDRVVSVQQGAKDLGSYTIDLDAFGANVYDVEWTIGDGNTLTGENGIGAVLKDAEGNELTLLPTGFDLTVGGKQTVTLDLSAADTSKPGRYTLTLVAWGKANETDADRTIQSLYEFQLNIRSTSHPQPPEPECPCKVLYYVGSHGVTTDATIEDVSEKNRPSKVPGVTALEGYVFRGWSLTNPATLKDGEKIALVDPKTVEAKGETMTFYAVIVESGFHKHYIVGYPNGDFGPADDITRASVATIIARAVLPGFVEGSDYGNPGNYTDVEGHWAASAIAYCSEYGVFKGYEDGTFRPDEPITRQEFATVMARLDGELTARDIPFDDIDEAGAWALNGIYTSYEKGWVNGYTDGTFKPLNNIRRDEAVKIFNAYLYRGVDAEGLSDLYKHVQGTAGNGTNEYKTWDDVPENHWAYYEIIEASNDHEYVQDFDAEHGYTVPEHWSKCWVNGYTRSLAKTSAETGAATAASGFRVWFH